jgi:hypothetical protein
VFTSYPTWREVAAGFRKRLAPALVPTTELKQKAHQLTLGKPRSEALRELNRFVSEQIRTVPQEFGATGYEPLTAGRVLKLGYGNSLDKVCLLTALLSAEGFTAYPLPIRTDGLPVIKEVPSPGAFNYIIVMAVVDNNPGYFDPCSPHQPEGRLPESEQGAEGLALDPKNYRFVRLPIDEFDRNLAQFTGDIALNPDGSSTGTLAAKLTGYYDARVRQHLAPARDSLPPIAYRLPDSALAARLVSVPGLAVRVDSVRISDLADLSKPVELRVSYSSPPPPAAQTLVLPAPALALDPLFALFQADRRQANLVVPPWRICRFTCLIHPGQGVAVSSLAPTWFKETPAVRATRWWEQKTSGIEFKSEFLLKKTDLNPDDYLQVKTVADAFRKPELRQLRFSR